MGAETKVRTVYYLPSHKQRTLSDISDLTASRSDIKLMIMGPHPAELLHDGSMSRPVVMLPFLPSESLRRVEKTFFNGNQLMID